MPVQRRRKARRLATSFDPAVYESSSADTDKLGFLSLPAEVRNRVYELVLAPGTVLIWEGEVPGSIYHAIRRMPGTDPDLLQGFSDNFFHYDVDWDAMLPVKLLRVCRQIHWEAALLLYSANVFAIDGCSTFGRKLAAPQRSAVASLELFNPQPCVVNSVLSAFPRVKELKVFMELQLRMFCPHTLLNILSRDGFEDCFSSLYQLARLPIETATVIVRMDEDSEDYPELFERSLELQAHLLRPWKDIMQEKRDALAIQLIHEKEARQGCTRVSMRLQGLPASTIDGDPVGGSEFIREQSWDDDWDDD